MNRLTSAFGDWMAAKVKKDKTPLVKCQTIDAARSANVKKRMLLCYQPERWCSWASPPSKNWLYELSGLLSSRKVVDLI